MIRGLVLLTVISLTACTNTSSPMSLGQKMYCSSEGTLSNTMPIQSHRSYCLQSDATGKKFTASTPAEYAFSMIDDQGNTVKNFAITHTKPMHVIIVRKDLKYFQHLHPTFNEQTGVFTLSDLTFPADGVYRIFADFAPGEGQKDPHGMPLTATISDDVIVGIGVNYNPDPIGSLEQVKIFEGYQVTLSAVPTPIVTGTETMLTFDMKKSGKLVADLEEYLGALGHSVILREGTLDFIHAHPVEDVRKPQNGKVNFMVNFPQSGTYKVFTQFQRSGKVFTTDFVVSVTEGNATPSMSMPKMDHATHKSDFSI